jgi:uncharacterized membrane protein
MPVSFAPPAGVRRAALLLLLAACGGETPAEVARNGAPAAADDQASTPWAVALTLGVMGNDTDPDADALTLSAVLAPMHGTAAAFADSVRYVAPGGFTGTDHFRYVVSDGRGGTDTAGVTVTVRATGYEVRVVGTVGLWSFASDAANDGSVVGYGYEVQGQALLRVPFLARGGTTVRLATLGGNEALALGVNGTGSVVGAARPPGNETLHAVMWKGGDVIDLGQGLGVGSFAEDVNDAGQVVGEFFDGGTQSLAVRWMDGQARPMGFRGAAVAITEQGLVAGFASEAGGLRRAWTMGQGGLLGVLPALGTGFAVALSMNDAGEAVGLSRRASPANRAVWWRGAGVSELPVPGGVLESRAHRINRYSQIAGVYTVVLGRDTLNLGAVWHQGAFHDLTSLLLDSRWVITGGYGITDGGMIAADGFDPATGEVRALALHPRAAPPAAAASRAPARTPAAAPPSRRRPERLR